MSLTAKDIRNCTMIALDQPPFWPEATEEDDVFKFTITVDGSSSKPYYFKFSMYQRVFSQFLGTVYWGDGEETEYGINTEQLIWYAYFQNIDHTYSASGTYQIKMKGKFRYASQFSQRSASIIQYSGRLESIDSQFPKPETADKGNFESALSGASNLKSVYPHLFQHVSPISFHSTFSGCSSLRTIPKDLFKNCQNNTDMSYCFRSCTSLELIPDGLFDEFSMVDDFSYCFMSCTSLTSISIPEHLFDNCNAASNFTQCFASCDSLTSIPEHLFDNCSAALNFAQCFDGCDALTSIPAHLFDNCSAASNFTQCFASCDSLTSIPEHLFDNCGAASIFSGVFLYCHSLISIPIHLFDNCINVQYFGSAFYGCSSVTSAVPSLWNSHPNADGRNCFRGCTNAANYSSIPSSWGGPA